jgi:DNA-binding FrmR family transcriptional regulator
MQYTDSMKNRLKRIEGQVRGLVGMMEREEACENMVTQLNAVRSAIDRLALYIVGSNLEMCIREEISTGESKEHIIADAVELLMKIR